MVVTRVAEADFLGFYTSLTAKRSNILFQHLEPWASNTAETTFRKICSIYFTRFSGVTFLS